MLTSSSSLGKSPNKCPNCESYPSRTNPFGPLGCVKCENVVIVLSDGRSEVRVVKLKNPADDHVPCGLSNMGVCWNANCTECYEDPRDGFLAVIGGRLVDGAEDTGITPPSDNQSKEVLFRGVLHKMFWRTLATETFPGEYHLADAVLVLMPLAICVSGVFSQYAPGQEPNEPCGGYVKARGACRNFGCSKCNIHGLYLICRFAEGIASVNKSGEAGMLEFPLGGDILMDGVTYRVTYIDDGKQGDMNIRFPVCVRK